jgi:hypothetical protein
MPGAPDWGWLFFVPPLILVGARWLPTARVRQLVGREHYGEVRLHLGSRVLTLPVLWDSGNQLTDHRLGRPVVIVDTTRARDWLTPALAAWVEAVHQKHDGSVPSEWQGRTAVVPFRTIAGPGELPVVAVDRAQGRYGDRWYPMAPVMVGLLREPIAADGSYAALADPKSLIRCPNERVGA